MSFWNFIGGLAIFNMFRNMFRGHSHSDSYTGAAGGYHPDDYLNPVNPGHDPLNPLHGHGYDPLHDPYDSYNCYDSSDSYNSYDFDDSFDTDFDDFDDF